MIKLASGSQISFSEVSYGETGAVKSASVKTTVNYSSLFVSIAVSKQFVHNIYNP